MYRLKWQRILSALAALTLAGAAILWAWNTLAGLFGAPPADFRHALAFVTAAATLRAIAFPHRPGRNRWHA